MDQPTPKPRKKYTRQPGAVRPPGRPAVGRSVNLPRVRPDVHALAVDYAQRHGITLADAVEVALVNLR